MVKKKRAKKTKQIGQVGNVKSKTSLVLNKLVFFFILGIVSFLLYSFINNTIIKNLFYAFTMVFGFIAVGFLIALLILLVIKIARKK